MRQGDPDAAHKTTAQKRADLEARLTFATATMQRLLDRQLARILAAFDLSLTTYRTLLTIDAFGEISGAELAKHCVIDKGLVSRSVRELVDDGLVERRTDPAHKRRQYLALTKAGEARLAEVEPAVAARNDAIDALLLPQEREALGAIIARITDHAAADLVDPNETLAA